MRKSLLILLIISPSFLFNTACKEKEDEDVEVTLPILMTSNLMSYTRWADKEYESFIYIASGYMESEGGEKTTKGFCYSQVNFLPTKLDSTTMASYEAGGVVSDGIGQSFDDIRSQPGYFESMLKLKKGQVTYYYRAFAENSAGISYGQTRIYTTNCTDNSDSEYNCKTEPKLYSPNFGASMSPLSVTLEWVPLRIPCNVYLDTSNASTLIASDVTDSKLIVTGLKPSTTYSWRVTTTCCKVTNTSFIWRFSTQAN